MRILRISLPKVRMEDVRFWRGNFQLEVSINYYMKVTLSLIIQILILGNFS